MFTKVADMLSVNKSTWLTNYLNISVLPNSNMNTVHTVL